MAKINGLKALFSTAQIKKVLDAKEKEYNEKAIRFLQFQGEKFVNKARNNDTYRDRTGNLRASIGYLILKDGKIVDSNFQVTTRGSGGATGKAKGEEFANDVSKNYPKGFVLIGVAGMNYAAYVEAKGYDVITGSAPTDEEFKRLLNEIEF